VDIRDCQHNKQNPVLEIYVLNADNGISFTPARATRHFCAKDKFSDLFRPPSSAFWTKCYTNIRIYIFKQETIQFSLLSQLVIRFTWQNWIIYFFFSSTYSDCGLCTPFVWAGETCPDIPLSLYFGLWLWNMAIFSPYRLMVIGP
jgi:hypothetical protein